MKEEKIEKVVIPQHLKSVNIYHPFKGSRRDLKVRKSLVDLIIPNGAGPNILKRLLDSLLANMSYSLTNAQGKRMGGVRVIVVSQGMHGSHDLLEKYQKQYPDTIFPIYKEKNFPPPIPYDDGLEYSARKMEVLSEYIMFLDDDMVMLQPGMIEAMVEHLEKNKFDNIATMHCFFGDEAKIGPNGEVGDFGMGSFLFKRKIFEKIGYLDEWFKFHCTDTDFNRRLKLWGGKIALLPNSRHFMHHDHQQGTHNFFRGSHQPVIDKDWVDFATKWNDHPTHKDGDVDPACPRCIEIAQTQLPLGRAKYLYGDD